MKRYEFQSTPLGNKLSDMRLYSAFSEHIIFFFLFVPHTSIFFNAVGACTIIQYIIHIKIN